MNYRYGIARTVTVLIVVVILVVAGVGIYLVSMSSPSTTTTTTTTTTSTTASSTTPVSTSSSTTSAPPTAIKLGYLPYFVDPQAPIGISLGYFNQSNLDVQLVKGFGTSTDVFTAMAAGQVDVSFLSVSPAAVKLLQEGTVKIIGGSQLAVGGVNASNSVAVLVSNSLWNKGVRTVSDLLNQTIVANFRGSPQTFEFEQWAKQSGLNYTQFQFTYIPDASSINQAFVSGKANVIIQAQPWVTIAQGEGGHVLAWDAQMLPAGYVYAFGALYVTTSFYNAHPAATAAFAQAWAKASVFYTQYQSEPFSNANKTAITNAAAEFVGVNASVIQNQTWPFIDSSGGVSASGISSIQQIYYNDGLITQVVDPSTFFISGVTLLITKSY